VISSKCDEEKQQTQREEITSEKRGKAASAKRRNKKREKGKAASAKRRNSKHEEMSNNKCDEKK
jgi:hypothetical protein